VAAPGTDQPQRVYELRCRTYEDCYRSHGSNNLDRNCAERQHGTWPAGRVLRATAIAAPRAACAHSRNVVYQALMLLSSTSR